MKDIRSSVADILLPPVSGMSSESDAESTDSEAEVPPPPPKKKKPHSQVWSQSSHCCLTVQWSGCTPPCVFVSQEQDVIAVAARLELGLMHLSCQVSTIKKALINNTGKELFAALFTYSLTTMLPMRTVSM